MRFEPLGAVLAVVLLGCGAAATPPATAAKPARDARANVGAPGLPDQRPADFRISLSTEGPKIGNITCDPAECVLTQLTKSDTVTTHKPVTPTQLDAIYKVVHDQTFDKLRVEAAPVADDAAVQILWVRVNGIHYGVMPHGKQDVAKADAPHFDAVRSALEQLSTDLNIGPNTPLPPPPGVTTPGAHPPTPPKAAPHAGAAAPTAPSAPPPPPASAPPPAN